MPQPSASTQASTRHTVTIGGETYAIQATTFPTSSNSVTVAGQTFSLGTSRPVSEVTAGTAYVIPQGKLTFAAVNASLNAVATVLLLVGLLLIKRRKPIAHQYVMVSALIVSAVFLACYLTSKVLFSELTTEMVTRGHAPKWATSLYLIVLIPHLLAAVGMLPLIAIALNHAYRGRFEKHRRIAKPTWFIWFYVSVSGVLVYWMLYHWLPSYAA